jgi:hypothetical protein
MISGIACTRFLFAISLLALPVHAASEGDKAFSRDDNAPQAHVRPNPYDKFIGLDSALGNKVRWGDTLAKVQVHIDPDQYSDKSVSIPILLGYRICDGVMAIKARDAEKLNSCASDIEKLARKMGVPDARMTRARMVRMYANRGEWPRVFLELAYLQVDIEATVQEIAGTDCKKILYAAGWLQGIRYTSTVVSENYNADASSLLREPRFVEELAQQLGEIDAKKKASPAIEELAGSLKSLRDLINVAKNAPIEQKNINEILSIASKTVKSTVGKAK